MGRYEALVSDIMGRGLRVPWHPAACQAITEDGRACGHAMVWHRTRLRRKYCEVPGCTCLDYVRMWPHAATDPRGAA
jgi:hypothetical protein